MISITDRMSQMRMDLREVCRDMDSISPKLSLWQKLKDKKTLLETQLQTLGQEKAEKNKHIYETATSS